MKGLLKIVLIIFTIALVLATIIPKTINNVISKVIIETKITNKIVETISGSFNELDQRLLSILEERITNNDQVKVITEIYVDNLLNDIINDTVSKVDISTQIDKIINDNINDVPLQYQNLVTQKVNSINFDNIYINLLDYVKNNISSEVLTFLKVYSTLTSKLFLFSIISGIILVVLLMYLITKPRLDFFYNIGICSLISGGFLIFIAFALKMITTQLIGIPIGLPIPSLGFTSLGLLIFGYLIIDICNKYQDKLDSKKS